MNDRRDDAGVGGSGGAGLSAEAARSEAEASRRLAEEARAAAESARIAGESARTAAEAVRQGVVDAVRAAAAAFTVTLEQMKLVEEMRKALRDARDVKQINSN